MQWVTVSVQFRISDQVLEAQMPVPAGPARLIDLLPALQVLTDAVVDVAANDVRAEGRAISCRKGCGACCRQLVPISIHEANAIRNLVDRLPETRQSRIRERFVEARERLQDAGLLQKLQARYELPEEEIHPLGLEYFRQAIPCPFLEDESCSIHEERPLACREYLVTSPAHYCAYPTAENVRMVKLPGKVSSALRRVGQTQTPRYVRWIPLVLAIEETDVPEVPPEHTGPEHTGPELLYQVFQQLTRES